MRVFNHLLILLRVACLAGAALVTVTCAAAAEPVDDESVDYESQVKPLLRQRCVACHGALRQNGGLRVDTAQSLRQGGDSGPAIVAGDSRGSLLLQAVTGEAGFRMPPDDQGKALAPEEIDLLRKWIDLGAAAPDDEAPEPDPREHWAFRPPVRPTLPDGAAASDNPIDALLAAAWSDAGVTPAPPAPKHILARRLYLDLTGLAPTREELVEFLGDASPDAYERLVDRLLASPRYGQRWGRHWMDVWRYSDWYGRRSVPDVMNSYPQIWRWRDWIVRSLNEDRGYDQMVREMLAADELAPEDPAAHVATGFIVRNWFKWNYNQWKRDLVEHVSKAFLGLTMNCAHCHDHKYDPISQEDYFRLRACFEPLELRHDRVPGEADPGPFKKYVYAESYGPIGSGAIRVFDEQLDAPTEMYAGGDERNKLPDRAPVAPGVPTALGGEFRVESVALPATAWYPGLREFVRREELHESKEEKLRRLDAALEAAHAEHDASQAAIADAADHGAVLAARRSAERAEAHWLVARASHEALVARLAADEARYLAAAPADEVAHKSRAAARTERLAALAAAQAQSVAAEQQLAAAPADIAADAREKLEQERGAAQAAVESAWAALETASEQYTPLGPQYPATSTGRRRALANWITSAENPLTARVAVNYFWMWHFGQPLVEAVFNFGRSGKAPSHPELLDWLATELQNQGWEWKRLHRTVLTSQAYRMDSVLAADGTPNQSIDPENRLLWRFPRQRMEAEVVRDCLLAACGELDEQLGGPDLDQDQGLVSRRRSLYFTQHGEARMQFLEVFDGVNVCDGYRRATSVIPQQALALSNNELGLAVGRAWATRCLAALPLETSSGERDHLLIEWAFQSFLSRSPNHAEMGALLEFLERQRALLARPESQAAVNAPSKDQPSAAASTLDLEQRVVENLVQVLLNHHDFVTIR